MQVGMLIIWFVMFILSVVALGFAAWIIAKMVKVIGKMFSEENVDKK